MCGLVSPLVLVDPQDTSRVLFERVCASLLSFVCERTSLIPFVPQHGSRGKWEPPPLPDRLRRERSCVLMSRNLHRFKWMNQRL